MCTVHTTTTHTHAHTHARTHTHTTWLRSLPSVHIPLFRLNYINTGELVLAQFIIPEHIDETYNDEVVAAQLELYWTKFLDR